jgi:hypothetical protein
MRWKLPASEGLAGCCCQFPGGSGRSMRGELNIRVNSPGPLGGGGVRVGSGSGVGAFGESWNMRENSPGKEATGGAVLAGGLKEAGASTRC